MILGTVGAQGRKMQGVYIPMYINLSLTSGTIHVAIPRCQLKKKLPNLNCRHIE